PPGTIGAPVDELVFQFTDAFTDEPARSGLGIESIEIPLNQTRFALELVFVLNGDQECYVNLRFDERRYPRSWARGFLEGYVARAGALVANPLTAAGDS